MENSRQKGRVTISCDKFSQTPNFFTNGTINGGLVLHEAGVPLTPFSFALYGDTDYRRWFDPKTNSHIIEWEQKEVKFETDK